MFENGQTNGLYLRILQGKIRLKIHEVLSKVPLLTAPIRWKRSTSGLPLYDVYVLTCTYVAMKDKRENKPYLSKQNAPI